MKSSGLFFYYKLEKVKSAQFMLSFSFCRSLYITMWFLHWAPTQFPLLNELHQTCFLTNVMFQLGRGLAHFNYRTQWKLVSLYIYIFTVIQAKNFLTFFKFLCVLHSVSKMIWLKDIIYEMSLELIFWSKFLFCMY